MNNIVYFKIAHDQEVPKRWKVGDKINTPNFGSFRIIKIPDNYTIVVREWKWHDYIAHALYAVKLIFIAKL